MPSIIVEVLFINCSDGKQIDKASKKIKGNVSQKWAVLQEFIEKRISTNSSFSNYTLEITGTNDEPIASEDDFNGVN